MSKITLEPNSSGAGTFSIVSPDSNTNRTLTLPNESGKLLVVDSNDNININGNINANDINGNDVFVSDINADTIDLQNHITIGGHSTFAEDFEIPRLSFRRRVKVTVNNYGFARVIVAARRTNASDSHVYWEGYLANQNNSLFDHPLHTKTSGGTISYSFSSSGADFFWDFNDQDASAEGVIILERLVGSVSFTVTTY